jgi:hypothetical protein
MPIAKMVTRQQPTDAETPEQRLLSVIIIIVLATLLMQIMMSLTDVKLIYLPM